uniref:Uncharacterized protein n=1 Tax=viral metagenome TaxID=1070528 RepID=A0A6C0KUW0_9ZZZZ
MEDIRWFIPTIKEAILFIMILFLLILTMNLYHNNTIQLIVNNISRCIRDAKIANSSSNIYTVTAVNRLKVPLFDITYDLTAKTYTIKCRLPTGNVVNNFNEQIPVYDFVEKQTAPQLINIPLCNSDKDYTSILYRPFTYTGYSPLVNFITSKGVITDMFDGNGGLGGGGSGVTVGGGVTRCSASVVNSYKTAAAATAAANGGAP